MNSNEQRADQKIEQKIAVLGLSAPRITLAVIDALVDSLTFDTHYIAGTTTVVVTSMLPSGFTVATVASAAASPENFNLPLGIEIAIGKCRDESRRRLWELEGYSLKKSLHAERKAIAANAMQDIRATLHREEGKALADVLREQIEDMKGVDRDQVFEHERLTLEMLSTYTDAECLGLLLAVLASPRIGFKGAAA